MSESVNTPLIDFDSMKETVMERLEMLGVKKLDDLLVDFTVNAEMYHIKTECRTNGVPEGLRYVCAERCVGLILLNLYKTGKLDMGDIELSGAVKQIIEGDVSITFDESASDSEKLLTFINYLVDGRKGELLRYRKLMW